MNEQQRIWEAEHQSMNALPSVDLDRPATTLISFMEFLVDRDFRPPGTILDIGCGKGRHTIYLASLGFEAYGFDFAISAISQARARSSLAGTDHRTHFSVAEIDKPWHYPDNFFDLEVDYFASIDVDSLIGREHYRSEMLRTLKSGGYAFVTVPSVSDELEKELLLTSTGAEKNSTIWPENGKFQKVYDEGELRDFYSDFEILFLREKRGRAIKLGREYIATNFEVALRKG
jgi:SAM-dependent methyltransferase